MKQVSLKSEHFVEVKCLEETLSPMGARGLTMGEKIISWFSCLIITFHMKQVSLKSVHYCGSSLFGGNFFPPWRKGVDHGGKMYHGFHFSPRPSIWNKFHSNQTIIVKVHYLGETLPPMGKGGWPWGKNSIMVFISHHDLPYETSFTRIGALFWKLTVWGKRYPPWGKGGWPWGRKL